MTELELFKSWLNREKVEFSEDPDSDGCVELSIDGDKAIAFVSFRKDGTFNSLTAAE